MPERLIIWAKPTLKGVFFMNVLVTYPERCVGCRICEQWRSWKHEGRVNPTKARVRVSRVHAKYLNIPVTCMQCAQSPCIAACREGALSKDPATGAVLVNEEKGRKIGRGWWVQTEGDLV